MHQFIFKSLPLKKTHHCYTNILDDSFRALCIDYWNTGTTVIKGKAGSLSAEVKMEDWFVQEIYTGVFPLVPEAVQSHLVRLLDSGEG